MDDRLYLAVYDQKRLKKLLVQPKVLSDGGSASSGMGKPGKAASGRPVSVISKESYVCEIVLPGYEACELQIPGKDGAKAHSIKGICRSRFAETPASLYVLDESILPMLDQEMAPELVRHQAMAADDERLYNVYVYVSEQEKQGSDC